MPSRYEAEITHECYFKLLKVQKGLEERGFIVERPLRKRGGWETAEHITVVIALADAARRAYPEIMEFLRNSGFIDEEIISLGLSRNMNDE